MNTTDFLRYLKYFDYTNLAMHILFLIFALFVREFMRTFTAFYLGERQAILSGQYFTSLLEIIKKHPLTALLVPFIASFSGSYYAVAWVNSSRTQSPQNTERHIRIKHVIIAIAGPLTNLFCAALIALLYFLIREVGISNPSSRPILGPMLDYLKLFTVSHLSIMLLHLTPLPPFDSFTILSNILPSNFSRVIDQLKQYPIITLVAAGYLLWHYLPPTVDYVEDCINLPMSELADLLYNY